MHSPCADELDVIVAAFPPWTRGPLCRLSRAWATAVVRGTDLGTVARLTAESGQRFSAVVHEDRTTEHWIASELFERLLGVLETVSRVGRLLGVECVVGDEVLSFHAPEGLSLAIARWSGLGHWVAARCSDPGVLAGLPRAVAVALGNARLGGRGVPLLAMQELVAQGLWPHVRRLVQHRSTSSVWRSALHEVLGASMDPMQACGLVDALSGKNVFLSGGGGCGKSWLGREVIRVLRLVVGNSAVVAMAPTRMAAAAIGGETIQSWAGMRPGAAGLSDVASPSIVPLERLSSDSDADADADLPSDHLFLLMASKRAHDRARSAAVVVVDEVSMVSDYLLRALATRLKQAGASPQWIFIGDFAQLPAVMPEGSLEHTALEKELVTRFVFQSETWRRLDVTPVLLEVNHRTQHPEFARLLAEIRLGVPQEARRRVIATRLRALTASSLLSPSIGVFPTKTRCKAFVETQVARRTLLPRFTLPSLGWGSGPFKLPAVVTVHLGETLRVFHGPLRGLVGVLTAVHPDSLLLLKVDGSGTIVRVTRATVFKEVSGSVVGERRQFPVDHGCGLTVHRAQGLSLDNVVIDCGGMFEPGQLYTALSRIVQPARAVLLNIGSLRPWVDAAVLKFYRRAAARPPRSYAAY